MNTYAALVDVEPDIQLLCFVQASSLSEACDIAEAHIAEAYPDKDTSINVYEAKCSRDNFTIASIRMGR